jgi:hypothetical protein
MTDIAVRTEELFRLPRSEALAAMRAEGLLPATTTERRWAPDPTIVKPAVDSGLIAKVDARRPYSAGKASLVVARPQYYATGANPGIDLIDDSPNLNTIFLSFETLGANRKCIAWFDLSVFGPGTRSFTLGATGNPSTVVVTNQATGGVRTWVPLALTSLADGRAYAWMAPTKSGDGGTWFATEVYGL